MPAVELAVEDLAPFIANLDVAKASAMIDDALAVASGPGVAPCIFDDEFAYPAQAKAILRAAVLRWYDTGSPAVASQAAGGVSVTYDTTQRRRLFWPSEITDLQKLCAGPDQAGAYSVDTAPSGASWHSPICSLAFGASYCSCGADITLAGPLYEDV